MERRCEVSNVTQDQAFEIFGKICTVNSISQILHKLSIEGGEEYPQGTLGPIFALFAELTTDVMLIVSDIRCNSTVPGKNALESREQN